MTEGAPLVLDLLAYIEQVEKLKTKPAFTVPTEYFAASQHELKGLPGLKFNLQSEGEDIWLRVPRLHEMPPPEPDSPLTEWITLPKSPAKMPGLRTEINLYHGDVPAGITSLGKNPDIQALFDCYVEKQWSPWSSAEGPRRKTIGRYNQLFSLQQAIASEGADTPVELVWGIGFAVWKKEGFGTPLRHPLITQGCEISLNEGTFDLEVRPRGAEPQLESDCYTEMEKAGVRSLEAFWKSSVASGAHRVNPFEDSTFEGVLKAAVGHLDPTGAYTPLTDDVTPPSANDKLTITNTWVLYARKRSSSIFLEDIKRLKKSVEAATSLPAVIRSFVERGDTDVHPGSEQAFRGLSSNESPSDALELYFPMAYNEEQVSIVRKLEHGNGVVVQGPPGTGKTHTIANIICHYLAQGKRILVTSKGESALTEVLGKLPESIRPLSVALLSNERDGMKQFEHSIQTIASSVASMNPTHAAAEIAANEEKLNRLHAKISYVDHAVGDFANRHMQHYTFQGKEVSPEEIARVVLSQADEHRWFDDDLPSCDFESSLAFDETSISALRQARIKVAESLKYLSCSLPAADDLPPWSSLVELHRDLVRARSIEDDLAHGAILQLSDSTFETFERAKGLIALLDRRLKLRQKLARSPEPPLEHVGKHLGDMQADDLLLTSLLQSCTDIRELERQRQASLTQAVEFPPDAELNAEFMCAANRGAEGRSTFGRIPFGKVEARKLIAAVTILGSKPKMPPDWKLVLETLQWRTKARQCVARWNTVASEFGIEHQTGILDSSSRALCSCRSASPNCTT